MKNVNLKDKKRNLNFLIIFVQIYLVVETVQVLECLKRLFQAVKIFKKNK